MKRSVFILIVCVVISTTLPGSSMAKEVPGGYVIILQAGVKSHEGMARALHAFLYAGELKKEGYDVVIIFDGAGTTWAKELSDPESESKILPAYNKFKKDGIVEVICDYCSVAFGVKEDISGEDYVFESDHEGHPSIAKWANKGYQILIL